MLMGVNILTNANEVAGQTVMHFIFILFHVMIIMIKLKLILAIEVMKLSLDSLFNQIME